MRMDYRRTIKLVDQPAMSREETAKYSDLEKDGRARLFSFPMGVKSVITSPSFGMTMGEAGVYQVSGIAWSGSGKIRRVEVSADGGASWAAAALDEHVLPISLTRFRMAWDWNGGPAVIMSRAIDEAGNVQPTRDQILARRPASSFYHYNGIQAWQVGAQGQVRNVHA